jgi:hypothetical protein
VLPSIPEYPSCYKSRGAVKAREQGEGWVNIT